MIFHICMRASEREASSWLAGPVAQSPVASGSLCNDDNFNNWYEVYAFQLRISEKKIVINVIEPVNNEDTIFIVKKSTHVQVVKHSDQN